MKTFIKNISWATFEYDEATKGTKEVEKTAEVTFKALNRFDKSQHKLHFKILSMFEGMGDDKKEALNSASSELEREEIVKDSGLGVNTDSLCDITGKAINMLVICDDKFTENDKKELLQDSLALISVGLWLFGNHFAPFFQKLVLT
jgi:hypothetical protein